MKQTELKEFLDAKVQQYEHPKFLETDPIQVPHRFTRKEDIEISAFLTATIAWGNRRSIINNALKLMELMAIRPTISSWSTPMAPQKNYRLSYTGHSTAKTLTTLSKAYGTSI